MAEALRTTSALPALDRPRRLGTAGAPPLSLWERRPLAMVQVAEIPGVAPRRRKVEAALGVALPEPGRAAAAVGCAALWTGPGRWLIAAAGRDAGAPLAARLEAAGDGTLATIDLSHARTVLRLAGASARDVLAQGCRIDLHPRAAGPGTCVVAGLAHHGVVLHVVDERPSIDIYVARSFAEDLWSWLTGAGAEYGLELLPPAG